MNQTDPRLLPRVLYIEDQEEARALARRLLQGRYLVLEASDPLDGLHLAEETRPDLVLLDENLPHMKGSEVATRLRTILPEARLVIISADTGDGSRQRALAAGAVGFISKPIDVDTFVEQINSFFGGKREQLEQPEHYLQIYQQELVERLENNVRQLTRSAEHNQYLLQQNNAMLAMLERRNMLLEAAARVGQAVTSILDLDELLNRTVDIICSEFELYYSGIFLVSQDGKWAVLRAGYGEPGVQMLAENFCLRVDENSMIGRSILRQQAQIALDVGGETSHFKNPHLPATRSEIALPLLAEKRVLGALTVQSGQLNAFSKEDITSLQSMADQVAIAINNARLMQELDAANAELVRTKTFEAIATATGEAIHWVGNKAAPIPGSVQRLREDLGNLLALFSLMQDPAASPPAEIREVARALFEDAASLGLPLDQLAAALASYPARRLQALLDIESLLEDLQIIENSAVTILDIKEGLIGPARQRHPASFSLTDLLASTLTNMGLPPGVIETDWPSHLPPVFCDPRQVEQVFNNLVKNAWEALEGRENPKIRISVRLDDDPGLVLAIVKDNGPGIPPDLQDKVWVSFFTTKGGRGGTGLGLSACMQIVVQNGGRIWLESQAGQGAAFFVLLPVAPPA
ncbi:MAG: ATP-binding protein [Chloroflexota bacterium]